MRQWNQNLIHLVQELHDAESRWLDALPRLSEKTRHPELKAAFNKQLGETGQQVLRLEQVARLLAVAPDAVSSKAMQGLVKEADGLASRGDPEWLDAAAIRMAEKVEIYGLAAYGAAQRHALNLGLDDVARLLGQSMEEGSATQDRLRSIAEGRAAEIPVAKQA